MTSLYNHLSHYFIMSKILSCCWKNWKINFFWVRKCFMYSCVIVIKFEEILEEIFIKLMYRCIKKQWWIDSFKWWRYSRHPHCRHYCCRRHSSCTYCLQKEATGGRRDLTQLWKHIISLWYEFRERKVTAESWRVRLVMRGCFVIHFVRMFCYVQSSNLIIMSLTRNIMAVMFYSLETLDSLNEHVRVTVLWDMRIFKILLRHFVLFYVMWIIWITMISECAICVILMLIQMCNKEYVDSLIIPVLIKKKI